MRGGRANVDAHRDDLHVVHPPVELARCELLLSQVLSEVLAELVLPVHGAAVVRVESGEQPS